MDLDECAESVDDCGAYSTCTNQVGGYSCACYEGYVSEDGKNCENVNDCASPDLARGAAQGGRSLRGRPGVVVPPGVVRLACKSFGPPFRSAPRGAAAGRGEQQSLQVDPIRGPETATAVEWGEGPCRLQFGSRTFMGHAFQARRARRDSPAR